MTVVQLQLNLWEQLKQAQAQPEVTDWRQLCLAFDETIELTPVELRLATGAAAIEQMADLLLLLFRLKSDKKWSVHSD